jgi:hypothetical protein
MYNVKRRLNHRYFLNLNIQLSFQNRLLSGLRPNLIFKTDSINVEFNQRFKLKHLHRVSVIVKLILYLILQLLNCDNWQNCIIDLPDPGQIDNTIKN